MSDLIEKLRRLVSDVGPLSDQSLAMLEAADELERLYTILAKGPTGFLHISDKAYRFSPSPNPRIGEIPDRVEPLYFIPAPEPKP